MTKNEKTQTRWHGKVFDFGREEIILPNGKHTVIEAIHHPGSSAVVPIFENVSILLIRQYRPVIKDFIWEIPSGTMLPGEEPLKCAKRELQEECGFQSNQFEKIGEIFIAPWYSDERIYLFLATELIPCEKSLDEDEIIATHLFRFDQAMAMIERGEIQDATTIIGLKIAYPRWKKKVS
jgi:8-oxo-dGTP pyrophosphatase MutT (NUDIX family)